MLSKQFLEELSNENLAELKMAMCSAMYRSSDDSARALAQEQWIQGLDEMDRREEIDLAIKKGLPAVTATDAVSGLRPVAKALGAGSGMI